MTDVYAGCGDKQEEQGKPEKITDAGSPGGYLAVLRIPGAMRFSAAAAVGRVPMAMFGLGSLLLVASRTGRYGLAGTIAAAGSVGYAICAPLLARLTDRFGQHRVLRPTALFFAAATAGFVAAVELGAPVPVLLVTGCLAGASMPSLGSVVRARWSGLLTGSPRLLDTAYALESVVDEVIFVVGPAVVTLLATDVQPASGVITASVLCVGGCLALAAQTGTEPPVHPREPEVKGAGEARGAAWTEEREATKERASDEGRRRSEGGTERVGEVGGGRGPLRLALKMLPARGLVTIAPAFVFLGSMFASIDLSTVAFAQQHGHKSLAGFILGTYALGSATGGIWYGSRHWRSPLERRFVITLCMTAAAVGTFWSLPGLLSLDAVVFFSGMTISPTVIAGFGLIERQSPPGRRTEGMSWLSSAVAIGVAGGSAVVGHIVDAGGARWGYVYAAGCGGVAAVIGLVGLGQLRGAYGGQAAQ